MSVTSGHGLRVLIPVGLGLNCEVETAHAFERLGARPDLVHLTDLLAGRHERPVDDYRLMVFVGGFSYGDHVGGGFVLATRIRAHMRKQLASFLDRGGLAIGICNGFQALVRLGLLPGPDAGAHDFVPRADLGPNDRLGYRNAWVSLGVDPQCGSPWLSGMDKMELPARHGEGKFLVEDDKALDALEGRGQLALRYLDPSGSPTESWPHNPNGSARGVAGVCDVSGRVLGVMPHPDAFLHPWHHPRWRHRQDPRTIEVSGMTMFENGLAAAREAR